jgi:hypothetical protein
VIARSLAALLLPAAVAAQSGPITLQSFDDTTGWTAAPSDGVRLSLSRDTGAVRGALRMSIDYQGHAGYAVARHAVSLPALPAYWGITLRVRGEIPPNTLEIKFVDSTGLNVWWMRQLDLRVTAQWKELRFRPRDLSFAWGPLGGGPPRGIEAMEIAFTAGSGGRGWLDLDELTLVPLPRPVADSVRPRIISSSTAAGRQTVTLDFHGRRDLSALELDWGRSWATDFDVQTSDDGAQWTTARRVREAAGGKRFIHLPGTEASWLRLNFLRSAFGGGYDLRNVRVLPDSAALTASAFLEQVAVASPRGTWPRSLTRQQSYWTVFGLPRDARDGLMSEDGSVDTHPGGFSLEPFLQIGDTFVTWADSRTTQSLDGGVRPMPIVTRRAHDVALAIHALATGEPGASMFWTQYRLTNLGIRRRTVHLIVAVRPVQVNPPWQFLGVPGGAASVRRIAWNGERLVVNDSDAIVPSVPPTHLAITPFDAGLATDRWFEAAPTPRTVDDSTGLMSAAFEWSLTLDSQQSREIWLALPSMRGGAVALVPRPSLLAERAWDAELSRAVIQLPDTALTHTLQTAVGQILINANGPAIQPGTRSYRRSWIRDGALTSAALLRVGHADAARAFLEWFAPHVFADGKVPCCVDARGSDPVTENDADGELLYLAAEYWRTTGDTATVRALWPALARTASHLDSLRMSRRTPQYRQPDSLLVFGLVPPSISHEGYSAKPAYSFWDDFWGVRGMADAVLLARLAGDARSAQRYAAASREFRDDVVAAVAQSMTVHHLSIIPGASELGDVDPTSTTIALDPAQLLHALPDAAVRATFDRAWKSFIDRRDGVVKWDVYTPYEWRLVGSFIRLGQPERALALVKWFLAARRPAAWHQWSEVVWRDARAPRFIGDMPHGWVASDFIRATLDLIAYEREADSALVVGAGIPYRWVNDPRGVHVRMLQTWWGELSLTTSANSNRVRLTIEGVRPPGGIELHAPFGRAPTSVTVDGRTARLDHNAVHLRGPGVVEFVY